MKWIVGLFVITYSLIASDIYDPEINNSKYRLLINSFSEKKSKAMILINRYDFSHTETKDTELSLVYIDGDWYLEIIGIMNIPQARRIIEINNYKVYVLKKP